MEQFSHGARIHILTLGMVYGWVGVCSWHSPAMKTRTFIVYVMECMHTQTWLRFTLSFKGVDSYCHHSHAGIRLLASELGGLPSHWQTISLCLQFHLYVLCVTDLIYFR